MRPRSALPHQLVAAKLGRNTRHTSSLTSVLSVLGLRRFSWLRLRLVLRRPPYPAPTGQSFLTSVINSLEFKEINFVSIPRWEPAVLVSMVVTAMMTELFDVPRRGGTVLLAGLHDMLDATPGLRGQAHDLPRDPRTVCRHLRLDPVTETFICCPACWALTPYTNNPVTQEQPDPEIPLCQDRLTRGSAICGEKLWDKETIRGEVRCTPRKIYVHQQLKNWLGRLLSRPGIEDILDDYPTTASRLEEGEVMTDIWSSPAIISLKGPDGKPFLDPQRRAGEGRFLFSLATDGFNPFHMKTAKQVVTTTGFWVLQGHTVPPSDVTSHSWISLPGTSLNFGNQACSLQGLPNIKEGDTAKAMLVPLTADMLAAREASGFTSATSKHFCIGCQIVMGNIEDFNPWPQRSHADHLMHANAWKNADSVAEQEKIAKATGSRYVPLLDLPYWQAVRYATVEPMHAIDLNIINRHIRNLFMIDLSADGGDGSEPRVPRPARPTDQRMLEVLNLFVQNRNSRDLFTTVLKSPWATFAALWHICKDRHLRIAGTDKSREWFVFRIQKYIEENGLSDEDIMQIPPPVPSPGEALVNLRSKAITRISESARRLRVTEIDLEDCKSLLKSLYRGTKLTSLRWKNDVWRNLCRLQGISIDVKNAKRRQMYDLLMATINTEKSTLPLEELINRGPVLGRDVMSAIWADMRKTILPTWITAAPKNWGTAKRGKLAANHWRTIFTIHLPITLIWLWRNETGRKRELLDNMNDLVLAVIAANFKDTSQPIADSYDRFYRSYIVGVAKLYKENSITPAQHSALHIGQNLREFGPGHSRSAHHYERYIHLLQKQNTNGKFGELEKTLLYSTARMANLKALLSDNADIRTQVAETVKVYERESSRESRGARLMQFLDSDVDIASKSRWGTISSDERQLLRHYLSRKYAPFDLETWKASAFIMDQISHQGVRYARQGVLKYDGDSHIIFRLPEAPSQTAPGKIVNIFQFWHTKPDGSETKDVYLVVRCYGQDPVPVGQDPYRKYARVLGYLAGPWPAGEMRLIEPSHIQSHFALTLIKFSDDLDLIHVFPLGRNTHQHWQWNEVETEDDDIDGDDMDMDDTDTDEDTDEDED
ncbi:hypothetical protein B0H11DRAFT_2265471 [Mycena galericulata]|nr:hypothetical protein B0H11DRAFT_2265471 [Mycena galericulata]